MHRLFALPAIAAVAAAGLWTGSQTAMHAGSLVPEAHAGPQETGTFPIEVPAFVVTIRTMDGPVRHVAADIDATLSEPFASNAEKDRLAEAVLFSAAKTLGDPKTALADGQSVAISIADAASARLDGAVTGIHVRKISVFDQAGN